VSGAVARPGGAEPPAYLAALRAVVLDRNPQHALARPDLDPAGFVGFLERHRLLGYVYRALQRRGMQDALPAGPRAQARAYYLRQWTKNERLAAELARLSERFRRAGLDLLALKGPLFAERYYGDLDARSISDLDFLGRRADDVDVAERLLLEDGYRRGSRLLLGRRVSRAFTHHFEYYNDDLAVELHWVLQRHPSLTIDYARLWRTAETFPFRGRAIRAPSDEYELVTQIVSVLVDLQVGKLTLKAFVDLYHLLAAAAPRIDWDAFFACRRQERLLRGTAFALALLAWLLDCADEIPGLVCRGARPPALERGAEAVLGSRPLDWGQKLLALRLYQVPLAGALGWWAVSLPFRLAVYRQQSGKLLATA
jgi:hypothetical protein